MAGIARSTQVLFATTGLTPVGGFGAAAASNTATEAGSSNTVSNLQTGISGAWAAGLIAAVLGSSKFPAVEDLNAVFNVFSNQIAYILERGIPEYDAGTTYNIGDIAKGVGNSLLYKSITNASAGNALTNATYWTPCGDLLQLVGGGYWCGTSGGSANAQTLTTGAGLTALVAGQAFEFIAGFTSTASTMNLIIDSVAATEAYENSSSGLIPVPAGGIVLGNVYKAKWDGVKLVLNATIGGYLLAANNLSDIASASTALANLGGISSLQMTALAIGSIIFGYVSGSHPATAGTSQAAANITPCYQNSPNTDTGSFTASGDSITGTWNPLISTSGGTGVTLWQRIA